MHCAGGGGDGGDSADGVDGDRGSSPSPSPGLTASARRRGWAELPSPDPLLAMHFVTRVITKFRLYLFGYYFALFNDKIGGKIY